MIFKCSKSQLSGTINIPGSKSHTIRALAIAALANGRSIINSPLVSADTLSALHALPALGVEVDIRPEQWQIYGINKNNKLKKNKIDVGNSGTTLRIFAGLASLFKQQITLTGDQQIQRRPMQELLQSLNQLGAKAISTNNNGCPPVTIQGKLKGGKTTINAQTSQFLTSLLIATPLAQNPTEIIVPTLNEKPYVQITLDWLQYQNIKIKYNKQMTHFYIPENQNYTPFTRTIPADFSSASFFLAAGALQNNQVTSCGLDMNDSQPDKKIVQFLQQMGAKITITEKQIQVTANQLHGIEIDMNETPDALPIMAVVACFAKGTTKLTNVAHARIKETDRIAVMTKELKKMGAKIQELPDGLIIQQSKLHAAKVHGHHDHRVVMALALAGLCCENTTTITTAEAANVTLPQFQKYMQKLGGNINTIN